MFLGQIVKHGDIKCVLNEGMPIYRRPYEKGRLIIEFKVSYKTLYLKVISNQITDLYFLNGKKQQIYILPCLGRN